MGRCVILGWHSANYYTKKGRFIFDLRSGAVRGGQQRAPRAGGGGSPAAGRPRPATDARRPDAAARAPVALGAMGPDHSQGGPGGRRDGRGPVPTPRGATGREGRQGVGLHAAAPPTWQGRAALRRAAAQDRRRPVPAPANQVDQRHWEKRLGPEGARPAEGVAPPRDVAPGRKRALVAMLELAGHDAPKHGLGAQPAGAGQPGRLEGPTAYDWGGAAGLPGGPGSAEARGSKIFAGVEGPPQHPGRAKGEQGRVEGPRRAEESAVRPGARAPRHQVPCRGPPHRPRGAAPQAPAGAPSRRGYHGWTARSPRAPRAPPPGPGGAAPQALLAAE